MTDERSPGGRPKSWRAEAPSGATPQRRSWRSQRSKGSGNVPPSASSWLKRIVALAGVLLAAVGIYLILAWSRPQNWETTILVLAKDYGDTRQTYPGLTNPFAKEDVAALEALQQQQKTLVRKIQSPADIVKQAPESGALVLELNVVAVSRPGNGSRREIRCLFDDVNSPDDLASRSANRKSFLMADVWQALQDPKLTWTPKLVLLDLSRLGVDWRMGILENGLYDEDLLKQELNGFKNLSVLCSASYGQSSWTSPQLGRSVFGHFVTEALSGKAPVHLDREKPPHLVVSTFLRRVQSCTADWVDKNRGHESAQRPFFYATETLADVEPDGQWENPAASPSDSSAQLKRTQNLWERRDAIRQSPEKIRVVLRLAPLRWRQLHYQLMRAEELALAGDTTRSMDLVQRAEKAVDSLDAISQPGAAHGLGDAIAQRSTQALVDRVFHPPLDRPSNLLKAALRTWQDRYPKEAVSEQDAKSISTLREQADRVGAGPLGTIGCVREIVLRADAARYASEDAVFAEPGNPTTARDLPAAANSYSSASEIADGVALARETLETLLADLPEIATWASFGCGDSDQREQLISICKDRSDWTDAKADEAIQKRLEDRRSLERGLRNQLEIDLLTLFSKTRQLQRDLQNLPNDVELLTQRCGLLQERAKSALALENSIHQRLVDIAVQAENWKGDTNTSHRQEVADALRYSLLPSENRQRLLQRLVDCDKGLFSKPNAGRSRGAFGGATWHGLWILQIFSLSPELRDLPVNSESAASAGKDAEIPEFSTLVANWKNLVEKSRAAEDVNANTVRRGGDLAIAFGDEVRRRWRGMSESVRAVADSKNDSSDAATRRASVLRADLLSRVLHGFDASELAETFLTDDPGGDRSPSSALAQLELADLYLLQARRHLQSFWVMPRSREQSPWFAEVARAFCKEARTCGDAGGLRRKFPEADETENAVGEWENASKSMTLAIHPNAIRLWSSTDSRAAVVNVTLDAKNGACRQLLLSARPSIRLTFADADGLIERPRPQGPSYSLRARAPGSSELVAIQTFEFPQPSASSATSDAPCKTIAAAPVVFFRGRLPEAKEALQIDPCRPRPRVVAYTPLEDTSAELTVSGNDRGTIIFIFDCSLSMSYEMSKGHSRFEGAKEALRQSLRLLEQNNPKHRVELIAYGHRATYGAGINANWQKGSWPNFPFSEPNDPPTDPLADYQWLIEGPLDANRGNFEQLFGWAPGLAANAQGSGMLQPYGSTPLVGALEMAAGAAKRKAVDEIVIVTDGCPKDRGWQARFDAVQQRLKNAGITLRIIAIVNQYEVQEARKNAAIARGTTREKDWADTVADREEEQRTINDDLAPRCANTLIRAFTSDDLKRNVVESIASRREIVIAPKTPGLTEKRFTLDDFKNRPCRLQPGDFSAYFGEFRDSAFDLPLRGGERISLALDWETKPGLLRRLLDRNRIRYSGKAKKPPGDFGPDDPRWLGVESYTANGSARTAIFKLRFGRDPDYRIVLRPRIVNFRVRPARLLATTSGLVNWKPIGGELPGWEITVSDWPGDEAAQVMADWTVGYSDADWHRPWSAFQNATQSAAISGRSDGQLAIRAELSPKGEAVVSVSLANRGSEPISKDLLQELEQLQVRLGRREGDEFVPVECQWKRELYEEDGSVNLTFQVGPSFPLDRYEVGLNFARPWRERAIMLDEPLVVDKPDNVTR